MFDDFNGNSPWIKGNQKKFESIFKLHNIGKIRMLSFQIQDMSFLDAEQRIIHILLKLSADFGTTTADGIKLSVKFSDQELAGLVGVCRVTVTKTLNALKKLGLIDKQYRNITIKNQVGLLNCFYTNDKNNTRHKTLKLVD